MMVVEDLEVYDVEVVVGNGVGGVIDIEWSDV